MEEIRWPRQIEKVIDLIAVKEWRLDCCFRSGGAARIASALYERQLGRSVIVHLAPLAGDSKPRRRFGWDGSSNGVLECSVVGRGIVTRSGHGVSLHG